MTPGSSIEIRDRWSEFWRARYERTNYASAYGAHIYRQEARIAIRELAARPAGARVLSVGTGLGQVERMTIEGLPAGALNSVIGADLVAGVLSRFSYDSASAGRTCATGVATDARTLPFASGSFDAVLSFGRASLASYREVVPEVARVAANGGVVVMDFINHLSPYQILKDARLTVKRLLRHAGWMHGADVYPNFGCFGIRGFYLRYGLHLRRIEYLGAAPPLPGFLAPRDYAWLEQLCFAKRLLGRVLIGIFDVRKETQ